MNEYLVQLIGLGAAGGGLVVYGVLQRRKTRKRDPFADEALLRNIEVPDEQSRQDGALAIGLGVILLLAAIASA